MSRDKSNKIIISKLNSDLGDFSQTKFNVNLNRVTFIFLVILIFIILYSTRVVYLSSKTLQTNHIKLTELIELILLIETEII